MYAAAAVDVKAVVKLDVKRFSRMLNVENVRPLNVICCVTESEALILHVILGTITLLF